MVHHFKQRVVTAPEHTIVEFHDSATPEVVHTVFLFVLADRSNDFAEKFTKVFRSLPGGS